MRYLVAFLILSVTQLWNPTFAETPTPAETFIQTLSNDVIELAANKQMNDGDKQAKFRSLFEKAVDLPEISHFVLGRYWRLATPQQQYNFFQLFEDIYVLTWSQRFKDYNGQTLTVVNSNSEGDKNWVVQTNLVRNGGGNPIRVLWKVTQILDGSLKVSDIVVEGVSMALTQRQDFASSLQANQGNIDDFLVLLKSKVEQLKNKH
jgi:phospholipid transport system substrate-binding protein